MVHRARTRLAKCMTVALIASFILYALPLALAQVVPPVAKIASIDYPKQVHPGRAIHVTVVVDYSDKFLADVGVWDAKTGDVIRSLTEISRFTGPGKADFQFDLTAPQTETEWHLVAITRVWWQDAWYQDSNSGSAPFTINVSNQVTVTIQSKGAGTSIGLDGSEYHLDKDDSITVSMARGLHTLAAVQFVLGQTGARFVFVGWSDGIASSQRELLVAENINITAVYGTEYYLSVESDVSRVTGEGWYEEGQEAGFAVVPTYSVVTWFGILTSDYRFSGWSGNSNSTSAVASVLMDGPKSVRAEWMYAGTEIDFNFIASVLFLATLFLMVRGIYFYSKRRGQVSQLRVVAVKRWSRNVIMLFFLLVIFMTIPLTRAQPAFQPEALIVKIGDASWYYWNRVNSDTCLLWLGGGISQETVIGYNYYWVNPFEYESFGTMHFIQDLTRYYCVLALQEGSYESINPAANRTINQELYQLQSKIIAEVHDWIKARGYQHTHLVGYSVGGQAAAMEVAIRDPQDWTSRDGIILITVPLVNNVIQHAHEVQANLLFLYGGNLPDFVATGQQFFDNAPSEGWHDSYYYHKEFHILEDAGHEVWTIRETGSYDTRALNMVVQFVEKSKALQFTQTIETQPSRPTVGSLTITSVSAPQKVSPESIFSITANVAYDFSSQTQASVVAYEANENGVVSAADILLAGSGSITARLLLTAPANSSDVRFALYALVRTDGSWSQAAGPYFAGTRATNLVSLTVETSLPNIPVIFDGNQYTTTSNRTVRIDTKAGVHAIQALPAVYRSASERVMFTSWEDTTVSTLREVMLENDTTLVALYRRQFFVNATSPYGVADGSGWRDENSTAVLYAHSPMFEQPLVMFDHWAGDASSRQPRTIITINSPVTATAVWMAEGKTGEVTGGSVLWLYVSILSFVILLVWNLRLRSAPTQKNQGA